jgi:hypothetical protein
MTDGTGRSHKYALAAMHKKHWYRAEQSMVQRRYREIASPSNRAIGVAPRGFGGTFGHAQAE